MKSRNHYKLSVMGNMFRIIFKGDVEDIYLDNFEGAKLMNDLQAGKISGHVNLGGSLVNAGSIKAVLPGSKNPDMNQKLEDASERLAENEREYAARKKYLLSLPPAERAKNTSLASLVWYAVFGRKLTEDERKGVITCQRSFFERNPLYAEANPKCYLRKTNLTVRAAKVAASAPAPQLKDVLPVSILGFVERQVANGIA